MYRSLLCFAALLLAGQAQAYVILESKYRVEVKPGVFEDQLVLKCDNGRKITVPWEARLSEACGEVDIPRAGKAAAAAAAPGDAAEKQDSQERQKEIMMSRLREQYGEVDERHVTVESGLGGAEPHFSPQMREILKRYELCRKNTKGSPTCASERNQAMAALSAQPSGSGPAAVPSTAGEQPAAPQPAAKGKRTTKHKQAAAKPGATPAATPSTQAEAETTPAKPNAEPMQVAVPPSSPDAPGNGDTEAPQAAKPAAPQAVGAPDRAAREQKIAQDYATCMRAKPKFECETARAAALKALDAPAKAKAKSKSAAKTTQPPDVAAN